MFFPRSKIPRFTPQAPA